MKKIKYCKCEEKLLYPEINKKGYCIRCNKKRRPSTQNNIALYKKVRKIWKIDPVTKIMKNKKIYNRKKIKQQLLKKGEI